MPISVINIIIFSISYTIQDRISRWWVVVVVVAVVVVVVVEVVVVLGVRE